MVNKVTIDEHRILVDAIIDSSNVIHKGQLMSEDYDIVIDTLQKQHDILWKMTEQNMTSVIMGMGIMDDIRLEQMDQLKQAMDMWRARK